MKQKKCKYCKGTFQPIRPMQSVCNPKCAYGYTIEQNKKKFKQETRKAKSQLKKENKSYWIKEAQREFNKFIRLRDKDDPCISCGVREHEIVYEYVGGRWDCGHFLTRGAYPELRFNELNAHKQCKKCNGGAGEFSHKARTVTQEYEERLIQKIGQELVDYLKGPHPIRTYTIDELKEIKEHYKQEIKRMEKELCG